MSACPELRRLLAAMFLLVLARGAARGQSPQEVERRKLLEAIGLQKAPPPAAASPEAPADAERDVAAPAGHVAAPSGKQEAAPPRRPAAAPSFRKSILPLMTAACGGCHRPGGPGGATRLVLSGDPVADHAVVARLADVPDPPASALLRKASGAAVHGGGAPWPADGAAYARVLAWIRAGAALDGGAPTPVAAPPVAVAPALPHVRPVVAVPAAGAPETPPAAAGTAAGELSPQRAAVAPGPGVHELLTSACASCHRAGGMAATTRLVLTGDRGPDDAAARALVDVTAPGQSPIVTKAAGQQHGGGVVLPAGDPRADLLLDWARSVAAAPAPVVAQQNSAAPA